MVLHFPIHFYFYKTCDLLIDNALTIKYTDPNFSVYDSCKNSDVLPPVTRFGHFQLMRKCPYAPHCQLSPPPDYCCCSRTSYKWDPSVCPSLFHVLFFTFHLLCCMPRSFTPLRCIARTTSMLIHSTVDGHLGGFQFRVIRDQATMSILVQTLLLFKISFEMVAPRRECG